MPYHPTDLFAPARLRGAGLALAATLLLTGCQGGTPSPPNTTTAEPTSSATATGAPAPAASDSGSAGAPSAGVYKPADAKGKAENVPVPVMPDLAKENSREGLEAFVRYWYAQLSYVDETGDMSGWLPLFTPDCRLCMALQESGNDGYRNNRWLEGGRITVPSVEVFWVRAPGPQVATVQVIQEEIKYYNADGTTGREASEASNDAFAFFADYVDDGWKVVDLGVIA
ncbi:DUF6318 family protein [Paenarthrobacter ureafaciens]|uniref:DUF6318 family protein n=1 Tax=Paenarthrobacter sp. PAE-2 TaxID=2982532 RepID=UPI00222FC8D4|nr:DUF6318 family protein [Paenarthrobacter sp. PAE-2]MCW3768715.1 DUF6318 family protein [Paenarthrobacter sp. PAE-2]